MKKKEAESYLDDFTPLVNIGGVYSKNATNKQINKLNAVVSSQDIWQYKAKLVNEQDTLSYLTNKFGKETFTFETAYEGEEFYVWGLFVKETPVLLNYVYRENENRFEITFSPQCEVTVATEIALEILKVLEP